MAVISAPKPRWYVTVANTILDYAINGLGATAAYTAIIGAEAWLGNPFFAPITKWAVEALIGKAEERIAIATDKGLIRLGADIQKDQYDKALEPIKNNQDVSDAELQKAKDAIDSLGHRS